MELKQWWLIEQGSSSGHWQTVVGFLLKYEDRPSGMCKEGSQERVKALGINRWKNNVLFIKMGKIVECEWNVQRESEFLLGICC